MWDERAFRRPDSQEAKLLARLYRRLDAAERSYHRALKELNKYAAARAALEAEQAAQQEQDQQEAAIEAAAEQKLASFLDLVCPTPEGLDSHLSLNVPPTPKGAVPALSAHQK